MTKEELKKMGKILEKLTMSLASQNISFYPPRNNSKNMIRNNPKGFQMLITYLDLEATYQGLLGNEKRSLEVREHHTKLVQALEDFNKEEGLNNG